MKVVTVGWNVAVEETAQVQLCNESFWMSDRFLAVTEIAVINH
ncbi:MAG: hypothetical protein PVH73_00265 [Candidatus Bathyarchaeota archaeon]